MKTNEFIEEVKNIGYLIIEEEDNICIYVDANHTANIDKNKPFTMRIDRAAEPTEKLNNLIYQYLKTPINERENTKQRYIVEHIEWNGSLENSYAEAKQFFRQRDLEKWLKNTPIGPSTRINIRVGEE